MVLSHRAILSNIAQIRAITDFTSEDRIFNALPDLPLLRPDGGRTASDPDRHQAVPVPFAPALPPDSRDHLRPQLQHPVRHQHVPRPLRASSPTPTTSTACATWSPGPRSVSEPVRELWFEKFGTRIYEGYGVTETAPVYRSTRRWPTASAASVSCCPAWRPSWCRFRVSTAAACCTCAAQTSCWAICTTTNPGVLEPPKSELGAGWYETGDIVEIDADGFVTSWAASSASPRSPAR